MKAPLERYSENNYRQRYVSSYNDYSGRKRDMAAAELMVEGETINNETSVRFVFFTELNRVKNDEFYRHKTKQEQNDEAMKRLASYLENDLFEVIKNKDITRGRKEIVSRVKADILSLVVYGYLADPERNAQVPYEMQKAFYGLCKNCELDNQGGTHGLPISNTELAKREIKSLNKRLKKNGLEGYADSQLPDVIADDMMVRCDMKTILEICDESQRLVKGDRTVWEYLLLFINVICLGKDVTGIKAQESAQKELLRRATEPQGGGRGAE